MFPTRSTLPTNQRNGLLNVPPSVPRHNVQLPADPREWEPWSLKQLMGVLRRRILLISAVTLSVLALAAAYIAITPARYTAAAGIVLDTSCTASEPMSAQPAPTGNVDLVVVESQIETVKSENVALAVIRKLHLERDPEFIGDGPGIAGSILAALGLRRVGPDSDAARLRRAAATFEKNLKVHRLGRSYVAEIAYTSRDPEKAALIANETAAAYIGDQLGASAESARKASAWMEQQIEELREKAGEALRAVEEQSAAPAAGDGDPQRAAIVRRGQVRLRELEAQTYKQIYETLLNRYTQTLQRQSLQMTNARVVSAAAAPLSPSSPRVVLILLLALVTGGGLGVAAAFGRDHFDRRIRGREQIEHDLGIRVLGAVPRVKVSGGRAKGPAKIGSGAAVPVGSGDGRLALFADGAHAPATETLRAIVASLVEDGRPDNGRVIGIVSALRGEGKTTLAFNLAAISARSGRRTLLIDGDLRSPSLTRALEGGPAREQTSLDHAQPQLADSPVARKFGFDFLRQLPVSGDGAHPADVLASRAFGELLASVRRGYELVLIDLPSLADHVDAEVAAKLFDGFVLVAEQGRVTTDDIDSAMAGSPNVAERLFGVILNKIRSSANRLS